MNARIDLPAVVRGAAVILAVLLPPVFIVRALKSGDAPYEESYLWMVPVVFILVSFPIGGGLAARRRPDAPLIHAAAAAFLAFALTVGVAIVRLVLSGDGVSAATLITMILYLQIAVSLGVLGGYLSTRRRTTA